MTGLLHNFGAPPRSKVVVAAGVRRPAFTVVIARHWLPPDGERWFELVCRGAGVEPGEDAEASLTEAAAGALEAACAPAAAVTVSHNPGVDFFREPLHGAAELAEIERRLGGPILRDRLLGLAILSRASGRLFLRARSPRFDRRSLDAACAFPIQTFRVSP